MSYEGFEQHVCKNGHRYDIPVMYYGDSDNCHVCGAESAWFNGVDDTNGESYGKVPDDVWIQQFILTEEEWGTCNMGHRHMAKAATFRIPSVHEHATSRHWWTGCVWERCK